MGIIAEYNPFHNGHLYHLKRSIELTDATHTVAVMSGNFVQRGGPAVISKWARAEMAIGAGVDLVIELPVVYACRSAEGFAMGALGVLDGLGIVDALCFGSESGTLRELGQIARVLAKEPEDYRTLLRHFLSKGCSFPKARTSALEKFLAFPADELLPLLSSPNNILAIEYLKAMERLGSSISPYRIKRHAADYHSPFIQSGIASATAIRQGLIKSNTLTKEFAKTLPPNCLHVLERELSLGKGSVYHDRFSLPVITLIRRLGPTALMQYPEVSEGLENRIYSAAKKEITITGMLNQIKTRRYTYTRLRRILTYVFLDITQGFLEGLKVQNNPTYVRVLALNKKGGEILNKACNSSKIPIITKSADHGFSEGSPLFKILQKEALATDLFVTGYINDKYSFAGQDFSTSPFYLH